MKKVIFILVDSFMPSILKEGFASRSIPALQFLRDQGQYRSDCVTVFPTMTASIDSSLVTGVYPDVHKIPSLIWYDPEEKEIINYINGGKCVWKLGVQKCAKNVLFNLNEKHLSRDVKTIFEELSDRGLTSASINMIIHRGNTKHRLQLPRPLKWATRFDTNHDISGPDILTLGSMAYPSRLKPKLKNYNIGIRELYGINDNYAVSVVTELIESGEQPDYTMVYLPDNDHEIHKKNPDHGQSALIRVDQHIQKILQSFGTWEEALKQNIIIVTSDHGQTRVGKEEQYNIDLDQLLQQYDVLALGEKVGKHHQVVVCNNERMAYLYPLQTGIQEQLIDELKKESRIDLLAWKDRDQVVVIEGGSERRMTFSRNGSFMDPYGTSWSLDGDLTVMDIGLMQKEIQYHDYPDALARLYGALFSQNCPMIVLNARPRYEFKTHYHPLHNDGGSHGSLHHWDSLIPLFVAGAEKDNAIPPRLIDLKEYILALYDG
jgi:predicted AlkP superfamily pyrophosphatase or phosphodiesterase